MSADARRQGQTLALLFRGDRGMVDEVGDVRSRRELHFDVRNQEHANAQIRGSKAVKNCYHPIPATVQVRVGKMSAARQTGQHY